MSSVISTGEVRDVLYAYKQLYSLDGEDERECICGEEYGKWPHNKMKVGKGWMPIVCPAHEWEYQRDELQRRIVESGLSMPIPVNVDELYAQVPSRPDRLVGNPLDMAPRITRVTANQSGKRANWFAHFFTGKYEGANQMEHVVFYLHRTQMITMLYERRDNAIRDVILYAPIVVYWHNPDKRNGSEWVDSLFESRQYGTAIICKDKGYA